MSIADEIRNEMENESGKLAKPKESKTESGIVKTESGISTSNGPKLKPRPIKAVKRFEVQQPSTSEISEARVAAEAVATERLRQELEFASALQEQMEKVNEVSLNLTLRLNGLDESGTFEERLARWNEYLANKQQEDATREQRLADLQAANRELAAMAGVEW